MLKTHPWLVFGGDPESRDWIARSVGEAAAIGWTRSLARRRAEIYNNIFEFAKLIAKQILMLLKDLLQTMLQPTWCGLHKVNGRPVEFDVNQPITTEKG